MAGETLLEVRDVAKRLGGVQAVDGASLEVAEGSITALIGPNGAGKTTLFNVVSGLLRADRGGVRFAGEAIERKPMPAVARLGLVRTFQTARVFTRSSVLDNVMVAGRGQRGEQAWRALLTRRALRRDERALEARARELLTLVRLDDLREEYAGALSGGQRKLLELARALMAEPRMVLLDEPMAGVNPTLSAQLLAHVEELNAERGMTFLFIEHDLEVVMAFSDHVVVMDQGAVIAAGPPDAVREDARVLDAYLGAR